MIPDRDRPIAVNFIGDHLIVTLANQRRVTVPLENYPALAQTTFEQRANVQLGLSAIYWPDLNLNLSLLELLGGTTVSSRRHKPRFCEG